MSIPLHQPVLVPANSILQFKSLKKGARCYLALLNELHIDSWLNSYGTNLKAGVGGWKGRGIRKDDEVNYESLLLPEAGNRFTVLPWHYKNSLPEQETINFITGKEWGWLTVESQKVFTNHRFVISALSDRMGYRLQGPPLEQCHHEQLLSSAVSFGTVQLLPNGQTIVLMADHQTTGGYPRIAHVATADLPKLAQLTTGQSFQFGLTTVEAAQENLVAQQEYLKQLQKTCDLKMQNWLHAH